MSKFEKAFKKGLILEQPEMGDEIGTDAEVFAGSFENPEDAEQFNVDPVMPGFESKYVKRAKGWIAKIDGFSDWVNGTEEDSLNKQFIDLDKPGSPFEGISSHSKKLTSMAEDLAALQETIKGYILGMGKTKDAPQAPQE